MRKASIYKAFSGSVPTRFLGKHDVSISAATQKESNETGFVPVVALMHRAKSSSLEAALAEIRATGVVSEDPIRLRMI